MRVATGLHGGASALMLLLASAGASAADGDYPVKPIRVIVPFATGGSTDILIRTVGQRMGESLGQSLLIDNRGGAGGALGAEMAAKAPPDGYTIMATTSGVVVVNPSLYKKLSYDPLRDFLPVSIIASLPNMLVVPPTMPVKDVRALIALAKARPGQLFSASSGNGSSTHLAMELFKVAAGVDFVHVPHNGSAPAVISTMTGETQIYFGAMPAVLQQAKAGKLRALAITSARRRAAVPSLPTAIEAGVAGYEIVIWNALFAPRSTPSAIISRLNVEVIKILELPDVRDAFAKQGAEVSGSTPEQLAAYVAAEFAKWGKVVAASGAKLD